MYSDTHFHFHYLVEQNSPQYGADILATMAACSVFFGLDIGTRADDLLYRRDVFLQACDLLSEQDQHRAESFFFFSAGIWPDPDSIRNREACMQTLKDQIASFRNKDSPFAHRLVAIGEGGLDHHWNPSGVDRRTESDFDRELYEGERELFAMQLELARSLQLPFIIHSREAYDDTAAVLKEVAYDYGIVHCYSYGLSEARFFLDRGWYIAVGGAVTYAKKKDMAAMEELLRYIPADRLLLETDSPYLAPVPLRGQPNNPTYIRHSYDFVAQKRGISVESLCDSVDANCRRLFSLPRT